VRTENFVRIDLVKESLRHDEHYDVALLCGFDTPSLAAQGGQRLPSYFNIQRGNSVVDKDWI
jgi:hypothetical protein